MKWSKEQRIVLAVSSLLLIVVVCLWIVLFVSGESLVASMLDGKGLFSNIRGYALRLLPGVPPEERAAALLGQLMTFAGRTTTVYAFCQAILLLGSIRNGNLFSDFFSAESHPLNLAIFRILFFVTLYPRVGLNNLIELSQLPKEMRVPPPGLAWLVENLIQSEAMLVSMYAVFCIACLAGAIGLCTRTACIIATCLAFYLMGVPQFFGKINHYHHIVWVGALLSVSRCADVLSVDSVWSALRGNATLDTPRPSRAYAMPLRFVWLFLGVLYFFPGLWKYVVSGPQWFLSDNLQARMLLRMFVSEGWEPIVRFDQYPLLCKVGGLVTILMEVGFIFLVFSRWGRWVAATGGLLFHTLVRVTMNISFWPIHAYYASFVDWRYVLKRTSRWLFGEPLLVKFESQQAASSRITAAIRRLDIFGSLDFQETSSVGCASGLRVGELTGWRALLRIARACPMVYLLLPFWRWVSPTPLVNPRQANTTAPIGVLSVGMFVIVANLACGFTMTDTWPVGVYPTFARIIDLEFESISMDARDADGRLLAEVELYYDPAIRKAYPLRRLASILQAASRPTAKRSQLLRSLWEIWREQHPEVEGAELVNFYTTSYSTDPELASQPPVRGSLIETVAVAPAADVAVNR